MIAARAAGARGFRVGLRLVSGGLSFGLGWVGFGWGWIRGFGQV